MAQQLTFDLPVRTALAREDFFVSPSNAAALALISSDWPGGRMVLVGPAGSGKTHLARVWAHDTDAAFLAASDLPGSIDAFLADTPSAVVVEDIDKVAGRAGQQEALFHLLNAQAGQGGRILLTTTTPPQQAGFTLPDLLSRLQGAASAHLDPPDDALLGAVIVKLFRDRQMDIAPEVVSYLVARIERSFEAARKTVDQLDHMALTERRAVTRPLVNRLLDNHPDSQA